ncbi:MAG: hypothetical protein WAX69_16930 [Victivallales bacterium]
MIAEIILIQEVMNRSFINYKIKGDTTMANETAAAVKETAKKAKKELTDKQIENRMKQTVTILRFKTLQSPDFWKQEYVPVELFFETLGKMEEIKKTLREKKVEMKIAELKSLGLELPANFKMKFND